MSDTPPNGNGHIPKISMGVQAYRWLVAGGVALLVLLSQRTLASLDDTVTAVRDLKAQVMTMQGTSDSRFTAHTQRLDTIDRRNDVQDVKIDGLWQRLWATPGRTP